MVVSPSLFLPVKGWPNFELDGLITRELPGGRQLILPGLAQITHADVIGYSPSLAGRLARSTTDIAIEALAAEIAGVVAAPEADRV